MVPHACSRADTPKRIRRSLADYFTGERLVDPEAPDGALTYDLLLSIRGWGRAEFEAASPDFLAGARFALFLEKAIPLLREWEAVRDIPVTGDMSGDRRIALFKAKRAVEPLIPALTSLIYPEDDDLG